MAAENPGKKELEHVLVYSDDKKRSNDLFGDGTSHARRFRAMLKVIVRERKVEHVRRAVLESVDDIAEGASALVRGITLERQVPPAAEPRGADRATRTPGPGNPGTGEPNAPEGSSKGGR